MGTIVRHAVGSHGKASATYSDDAEERYRYVLTRRWDGRGLMAFVMLNPSKATEEALDPTLRRCLAFARRTSMGGFAVVNLFALRATDPRVMKAHPEPVGPENDAMILQTVHDADLIVVAWGTHGSHRGRDVEVLRLLEPHGGKVYRLGPASKDGHPRHPLYLSGDSPIVRHR